jgi:hypothetical protein
MKRVGLVVSFAAWTVAVFALGWTYGIQISDGRWKPVAASIQANTDECIATLHRSIINTDHSLKLYHGTMQ